MSHSQSVAPKPSEAPEGDYASNSVPAGKKGLSTGAIIGIVVVVVVVLGTGLGIGLGIGLKKKDADPAPGPSQTVQFTFANMNYAALIANPTQLANFKTSSSASVATSMGVPASNVAVASLTSSSVVVTYSVGCGSLTPQACYSKAQNTASNPNSVFDSTFQATYSTGAITGALLTPNPPPNPPGVYPPPYPPPNPPNPPAYPSPPSPPPSPRPPYPPPYPPPPYPPPAGRKLKALDDVQW